MKLEDVRSCVILPALSLLPEHMDTQAAEIMLLAIGLQESRFVHRRQVGGPARGYWQFERGGGVRGVLEHHATREHARALCDALDYKADADIVYGAIEHNDLLACGFARLFLFTDTAPLPKAHQEVEAWNYYLRVWRPGKPHPETWGALFERASSMCAP